MKMTETEMVLRMAIDFLAGISYSAEDERLDMADLCWGALCHVLTQFLKKIETGERATLPADIDKIVAYIEAAKNARKVSH